MEPTYSELVEHLDRIKEFVIIVEGKNDKRALVEAGIDEKNIISINKRALYKVADEASADGRKVVILTDLDKRGRRIYSELNEGLNIMGAVVDNSFRNFLFAKTSLRQIEGVDSYLGRLEERESGAIQTHPN